MSRVEPRDETLPWQQGEFGQNSKIDANLEEVDKQRITRVLTRNNDLFTWTAADMPGCLIGYPFAERRCRYPRRGEG